MNKKEITAKVHELLASGMHKSDVFTQLSGQGVKDSYLAHAIASYPNPILCSRHGLKVSILVTIMVIEAGLGLWLGYSIGALIGPNAKWIAGLLTAAIPLLFAWGFYNHFAKAYNIFIILTIVQFHNVLRGFTEEPISTSIAVVINIGVLSYVWYVRQKLFPDFAFITPKKVQGEYVFKEEPFSTQPEHS
ncbi:hypothetical protein HTZ97_00750 [Desulfuromonas acetoxidans]|uniref:Permease n=1 Tax=Desulfuromonas acetoxidans (strain DSM 684 / 11070) TaxID=281689 RepID=Q1K4B8_DESA6|nr:hypothetical protein [Desulfuromonas acetoxidans]EAT17185.1 conserved hypothetical protein [Desulfuromonas acetoxidans DSM 684]MBF0645422.1 hypothetical protein [Desulfuromonas acetoxidans]NVD24228.1 hypothetical protein [Desulfuromonas acetoxidans]NVE14999.1 hypothetical protein [Desulfuromonas acetoxidans]